MKPMNYDEYEYIADNIFAPIYDIIVDDILKETGFKEGRFMDIGTGGGHLGLTIAKRTNQKGVLIDINPEAVERTMKRADDWNIFHRVEALPADISMLPFRDHCFKLIVSRGSMQFWTDYDKAFNEIYRTLKPGGYAYIGGGMGNKELAEKIQKQMEAIGKGKDRPDSQRRGNNLSTDEYLEYINKYDWDVKVIPKELGKGRWFVLHKKEN